MPFNPFQMFDRKHKAVQNLQYLSFLLVKAEMNAFFFYSISLAGRVVHTFLLGCCSFFPTVMFRPNYFPPLGYFGLFVRFVCLFLCSKKVIMKLKDDQN